MDDLTDLNPGAILAQAEGANIALWSETKREDFCKIFKERVIASQSILVWTAELIWDAAVRKHFLSRKHIRDVFKGLPGDGFDRFKPRFNTCRAPDNLLMVAKTRADAIIKALPPLSTAVGIIDPVTAERIDRKDLLEAEGTRLIEELETACIVIDMAEVDQTMTIRAFRKMVKDRDTLRKELIHKINGVHEEGRKLDQIICQTLYAGLPGLSDAVVEVIRTHLEQSIALETTGRRVEEQVKFGDCEAAVTLLRHFEKDEVKVSSQVQAKFQEALESLKVSRKGSRKKKS